MKLNWMKVIFLAMALCLGIISSYKAVAQTTSPTGINSTQDYIHVRESISVLSQKLYNYYKENPACSFSAEYNNQGKIVAMNVTGVSDPVAAKQISTCLMELESLGSMVRNMNGDYIPVSVEDAETTVLNQEQAEAYVPSFDKPSADGLITSSRSIN